MEDLLQGEQVRHCVMIEMAIKEWWQFREKRAAWATAKAKLMGQKHGYIFGYTLRLIFRAAAALAHGSQYRNASMRQVLAPDSSASRPRTILFAAVQGVFAKTPVIRSSLQCVDPIEKTLLFSCLPISWSPWARISAAIVRFRCQGPATAE